MQKKRMIVLARGVELNEIAANQTCCKTGPTKFKVD
jgi:hypothetical protein